MTVNKRRRRSLLSGVLLALGVIVVVPEIASAQANALFPDLYIRRDRPCETSEDGRYQFYRENYYGYFPTCWRRFPDTDRWKCPNPDAPNWEEALRTLPLEVPPTLGQDPLGGEDFGPGTEPDPFAMPGAEANQPALPELPPDEGSLFGPGGGGAAPRTNEPGAAPDPFAPRPSGVDPFAPTGSGTEPGGVPGRNAAMGEPPPLAAPDLSPPTPTTGTPAASRLIGPYDDGMRRTSREEPRRGLLSRWMKRDTATR